MLLKDTLVTTWPAFKRWSFDYFRERNPVFDEIYRSGSPGFQHFTKNKPFEKLLGLKPKFSILEMPARNFLDLFNKTEDYLCKLSRPFQ